MEPHEGFDPSSPGYKPGASPFMLIRLKVAPKGYGLLITHYEKLRKKL